MGNKIIRWSAFFCLVTQALLPLPAASQEIDRDKVGVSYIYAAVMGSGSYKIDDRRITMLNMPFSWTQREMSDTEAGLKWLFPVAIGHDSVEGSDWLDELFPDNLITLTILPGFEYQLPVSPNWAIKPFANFGVTHDFLRDEVIWLGVIGLSSLARFNLDNNWELRWGNKLRLAAERQTKSGFRTRFSIVESGLDIRRNTGFIMYKREIDIGGYYIFQHFAPKWGVSDAPDRHSDLENIHEIGFSVGLKKPHTIFGISFSRVRVGYQKGGDIHGITIGGEFPF
ncbi:MAG: hypothetical protein DRQ61_08315 [Gammaproteobacteria bacterium]|nr:MAG: hypothetical protein DRQ61_08315 [Gammaproteobacteria bacterium]